MFFPEFLYQLSARDQQVTWLDPQLGTVVTSTAATSVSSSLTVPDARLLVVTALNLEAAPGLAQNITQMFLGFFNVATNVLASLTEDLVAKGANAASSIDWQGEIVLPPGWGIRATGSFNAAAAANQVILTVAGILIPIGNVQRV